MTKKLKSHKITFSDEEIMAINFTLDSVIGGDAAPQCSPPEYDEHLRTGWIKLKKSTGQLWGRPK